MTIYGAVVLDEVAEQLNIDLPKLVAGCAFWCPVNTKAAQAVNPNVRRARSGEKRGAITSEGIRLDDNTFANRVPKTLLKHQGKFEGFAVCHIWPQTCYDERYHTMPANLVLLPRELAGLTDHNRAVEQCLQYRAWELYKWRPDSEKPPERPANYPDNWRKPVAAPVTAKPPSKKVAHASSNSYRRDVLPIVLNPSDPAAFRAEFINKGFANLAIHYKDGHVENEAWLCKRFGPNSNVIGNLRSKSKFRPKIWQKLGIINVVVTVPMETEPNKHLGEG